MIRVLVEGESLTVIQPAKGEVPVPPGGGTVGLPQPVSKSRISKYVFQRIVYLQPRFRVENPDRVRHTLTLRAAP